MIDLVDRGVVRVVRIDRPDVKNAVDGACAAELADAFRAFDDDDSVRVAVLTGSGETFCAGADLKAFSNRLEDDGDGPMGPSRMRLRKPVIAAVEGHAVAGGLELAVWCDLRVVADDATFGVFCRRFGVPLIDGGTMRLPRLIGLSRALDLILTGRPVGAKEALEIGLANRVVDKGRALDAAVELAEQIASFPRQAMLADRESAYRAFDDDALTREFERGKRALEEAQVGARAFAGGKGRHGRFD